MKRKIFTLMLCTLFGAALVNAQRPDNGIIPWGPVAPTLDGVIDAGGYWDSLPEYPINKNYQSEVPTLGGSDTYFKIAMTYDGIYVMINVADDEWYPSYESTEANWMSDMAEIYFDMQPEEIDGLGGSTNRTKGHFQLAPTPVEANIGGIVTTEAVGGWQWTYNVTDDATWVVEVFAPFSFLINKAGEMVDLEHLIGVDVCIIDKETGDVAVRKRAVWSNDGLRGAAPNENYNNMDEVGFMQMQGAPPIVDATGITIVAPSNKIITNDATLQLTAVVTPEDATYPDAIWSLVEETGTATLSTDGLLTPIFDGTVWVKAKTLGAAVFSDSIQITISNQVVTFEDINLVKNGNFDKGDNGKQSWNTTATAIVDNSWLVTELTRKTNTWDTPIGQNIKIKDDETKYFVKFKAFVDLDTVAILYEEDAANGYNKTLTSESPYRNGDRWDIPVTTEEQWFELDMTHTNWQANSNYSFNFQLGHIQDNTFYLDSVAVWCDEDLAKVTVPAESIELRAYVPGTMTLATEITEGGQLQVSATVLPASAIQLPVYSIKAGGTGEATIDESGLLTAVSSGIITVVGTDIFGQTVNDELEIEILVGVKDNAASKFSIAPNPVKDMLYVTTSSATPRITIYNTLGSKVYEGTSKQINTSNFTHGVYYIRVNDSAAQKFVK